MSTMEKCGQHQQQQQRRQPPPPPREANNSSCSSSSSSASSQSSPGSSASSDIEDHQQQQHPQDQSNIVVVVAAAAAAVPVVVVHPPAAIVNIRPSTTQRHHLATTDVECRIVSDSDESSDDDDIEGEFQTIETDVPTVTFAPPGISRKDERLIARLRDHIPDIFDVFNLHHRIGEGTFSTVFLATLRTEEHRPFTKRKCFAIKHLIPTSHPTRVERELKCLLEIGGRDNVAGVDLCMRRQDAVAFIMPYVRHDKFHDYFNRFDARELQLYMRNLFIALRRVHSFGIIHRDVKPSNFLHDRKAKQYLLVDFGLAQSVVERRSGGGECGGGAAAAAVAVAVVAAAAAAAAAGATMPDIVAGTTMQPTAAAQQQSPTLSFSNRSSGNCKQPSSSSHSQSVAVMCTQKKRKAAEIDETENCSNATASAAAAAAPATTTTMSSAAKRVRTNQQQQAPHQHTTQQYSNVDVSAASAAGGGGVGDTQAMPPTSPFKTPLKQFNEISTPKMGAGGQQHFKKDDAPLLRHIKTAVLGYSMSGKLSCSAATAAAAASAAAAAIAKINLAPASPANATTGGHRRTTIAPSTPSASGGGGVACYCYGKPTICNLCIIKKEVHASRAGTPGYRPPEVLLKHTAQTTAVDMWAIGVIMISILSACYPFFKGADDFTALAEMITIFGDEAIKKAALAMSRHVCHSQKKRPLHLRKLCIRLRNRSGANTISTTDTTRRPPASAGASAALRHSVCDNCQQISPECLCSHSPQNMDFAADIFPASAYDLMSRLLCINPAQRITAEEALLHPFMLADL